MVDISRRQLPLVEFRREILNCQVCFGPGGGCKHHEDVVGGYQLGRIVVVGINPQAAPQDAVYKAIQRSHWTTKLALSDRVLDIFAAQTTFEAVDPAWGWMTGKHRGVSNWLPRVMRLLDVPSEASFARNFAFVEAFKHATESQAALKSDAAWSTIQGKCPTLMIEQLERLQPRLVVLCGSVGTKIVAPLLSVSLPIVGQAAISKLHGSRGKGRAGAYCFPVLFTLAMSRRTISMWRRKAAGSDSVRAMIREHLR